MYANFFAVNLKIHTLEVTLQNLCTEVCHSLDRVGLDGRFGVLNHYHTILIIGIGNSKGILWQSVEEHLLCIAIVLEGLMVIKVVTGKIGKDTTNKL